MKQLATLSLFLVLALAGCDTGPQQAEPGDTAAPEGTAEQAPSTDAEEQPAAGEGAGQTQVLEESAAVSDNLQPDDEPIKLARADVGQAERDWKFTEGEHFVRLVPTQPTVGGADKIEVAEMFWYGCPHCRDLEPFINRWAENAPANVRFVRIPATWNPLVKLHAQLYYTEQALVSNGVIKNPKEFHSAVFSEYHQRGNRLASEAAIQSLFERHGVTAEQFRSAWSSFEVAQKLRVAEDLERRYSISGVPTVVVNGKYRTGPGPAGGLPELIEVVEELVARETIR